VLEGDGDEVVIPARILFARGLFPRTLRAARSIGTDNNKDDERLTDQKRRIPRSAATRPTVAINASFRLQGPRAFVKGAGSYRKIETWMMKRKIQSYFWIHEFDRAMNDMNDRILVRQATRQRVACERENKAAR
jgi:hypothetical protein